MGEATQEFVPPVFEHDRLGDDGRGHALAEPPRHAAAVQRQVGAHHGAPSVRSLARESGRASTLRSWNHARTIGLPIVGCPYRCDPSSLAGLCAECAAPGRKAPRSISRPVPVVDLPLTRTAPEFVARAGPGPVLDAWLQQLRAALAPRAPMRRIPAGITDDRLLGGLDIAATLKAGRPVAETGVLAQADGGVLVLAMAERIPPGAAARLAAALDTESVHARTRRFRPQAVGAGRRRRARRRARRGREAAGGAPRPLWPDGRPRRHRPAGHRAPALVGVDFEAATRPPAARHGLAHGHRGFGRGRRRTRDRLAQAADARSADGARALRARGAHAGGPRCLAVRDPLPCAAGHPASIRRTGRECRTAARNRLRQ